MKVELTEQDRKDLGAISSLSAYKALTSSYTFLEAFCVTREDLKNLALTKPTLKRYYLVLTPRLEKISMDLMTANNLGFKVGTNIVTECERIKSGKPVAVIKKGSAALSFDNYDYKFYGTDIKPISNVEVTGGLVNQYLFLANENYYDEWFLIGRDICDRLLDK